MRPCFNDITGRSAAVDDLVPFVHDNAVDITLQFADFHVDSVHLPLVRVDAPDLQRSIAGGDETLAVNVHPCDLVRIAGRIVAGIRS